jgi:hypothetical protein
MLLIIADLFKALWYVVEAKLGPKDQTLYTDLRPCSRYFVFPVIMFGRNRGLQDSPRLCNASGFLLSCGIEAAGRCPSRCVEAPFADLTRLLFSRHRHACLTEHILDQDIPW